MNYDELVDFIENRMRMSHVYQPLLIRALVDAGGVATVRQLAQAFLIKDESQLLYYEDVIKRMPVRVLASHGVVKREKEIVVLTTNKLSLQEQANVRMLCEKRLQEYIQKRGLGIWDYRLLEQNPVPDDLRYKVLSEAGGRCELCGATKEDSPLHVDHIIPKSRGGKNEPENLQALCAKCNTTKGNKDDTDFRGNTAFDRQTGCFFCDEILSKRIVGENGTVIAISDGYPVTADHTLIIPKRHTANWFTMTEVERQHSDELLRVLRKRLIFADKSIVGFNVGTNAGVIAGQTVMHAHIHLIPRREGDTPNPRGGVRGVVPSKMNY